MSNSFWSYILIMWHGYFGEFYYLLMRCDDIIFRCDVLRKIIYACLDL